MFPATNTDCIMEKFVNDRFCDNIDGSSYKYLHGRLISNTLKYLWEHVETKTENYTMFNDKREGEYKEWSETGLLCIRSTYLNGKREGEYKSWYDNGQLYIQCAYLNGQREGEYKSWYDNGELQMLCNFINDKMEGECEWWFKNGQFFEQCTYVNDRRCEDWPYDF